MLHGLYIDVGTGMATLWRWNIKKKIALKTYINCGKNYWRFFMFCVVFKYCQHSLMDVFCFRFLTVSPLVEHGWREGESG